ncbi:MAG: pyrroline-5-carboxylate reductase [Nitrospirae bacterium GWF2_44_13]|nr:MAG: pyrroline-5-carboxylate reductase [Nitrospirae bacterium GWF2_44_13]OGW34353.1 MAG: pyrroline-5-carboxylate reductase [Nitrospirae bacterium GWD2_44_7]OGW66462.1 MAG: pyrroline-5-carboxylate reductase [Nitrospirae bacterium RIFOXYA2_FULL_44_9]HBG92258.1 pyrroline-5-carboxylate reductase [Nitrospiraceae bacterium]
MTGFIGGGNMAEALIKGMMQDARYKMQDIIASEPVEDRRKYLEQTYGVKTTISNKEVASSCNIIILAVKPQIMGQVLEEIKSAVTDDKTVVSIAAGITLPYLQSKLNTKKIIRVMPNTPALVREAVSVMSLCECLEEKDINPIREIFMSIGKVLTLPEKYMNAVTALSGSGPAFIAFFIEAMVEGGVKLGLNKENASELAIQTLLGTASLLETGMPPEKLREMVTSPGGTTATGLKVFEEKGFKNIVLSAIDAAVKRAEELGRKE